MSEHKVEPPPTRSAMNAPKVRTLAWTRPHSASGETVAALAAAGIGLLELPLIGTRLASRNASLLSELEQAAQDARRIYVSATAVEAIGRLAPELLTLPAAAVGPQTADALRAAGCPSIWQPEAGLGADALLDLPEWAELGPATVTLVHAPGGREAPFERLASLGLHCRRLPVYQRYRRRPSASTITRLSSQIGDLAWLAPSVAVVDALADLLADLAPLRAGFAQPLLALSERIAGVASQHGFGDCRVVPDLQGESLLRILRAGPSDAALGPLPGVRPEPCARYR